MNKIVYSPLLMLFMVSFLYPQYPDYYIKKNTWYETLFQSREKLLLTQLQMNKTNPVELGVWYSVSPFATSPNTSFSTSFEPEKEIDLKRSYLDGKLKWSIKNDWKDGKVNYFEQVDNCVNYLFRLITTNRDTTIKVYLGSDDGIIVWLNDGKILEHNENRGAAPNQEVIDLNLKKGENKFLMKVSNNAGPTAFYFSTIEKDPKDIIWELIQKDFNSGNVVQEITWEKRDKIWDEDWLIGDYKEFAMRYANSIMNDYSLQYSKAEKILNKVKSLNDMWKVRDIYTKIRTEEYVVLTPTASSKPKINGAKIFGVRPDSPFQFTIAATGNRPIEFFADGLPSGLKLEKKTGIIIGLLKEKGEYDVTLKAKNQLGVDERKLKIIVGEKIALTPPLGWNSWNCFADAVDEQKVKAAADAMVKSGLANHGWTYINIDDFWENKPGSSNPELMGPERLTDGRIITNKKFPNMKNLGDYIHSKGLKMGIYSSPGPLTCGGCVGSYQHEEQDAFSYSEWGVDYLKYDWCSYDDIAKDESLTELKKPYEVMRSALNKVNRDIVYSLCQYGMGNVWEWGNYVGGNCWRTTGDITDTWESMSSIGFNQVGHEKYAKPGNWNDPDMLVVGMVGWGPNLHPTRLSPNEQYTHISLWCLLSSPLLIGCDMTQLDDFTLGLLTNDEVLDVNQDILGKQAARVSKVGDLEVWVKDLEDESKAVGLFNRGTKKAEVTANFSEFGLNGKCLVRDLWRQKDVGVFDSAYRSFVPSHGVTLVKIKKI
ncbi:MAG: putative Ig domain-containing protein [Ignavibacteriales bacterium]|nr:putative Ig domain-containing protein [Ignavibacteriales bacterium]